MNNKIIDLNVGGVCYTTYLSTLLSEPESIFSDLFETKREQEILDAQNRVFIDRDGHLFKYILDYLRTKKLILNEDLAERSRLRREAEYYKLPNLIKQIDGLSTISVFSNSSVVKTNSKSSAVGRNGAYGGSGYITIGFRGKFSNNHASDMHSFDLTDLKFRKISRIMVSGRVKLCREIFGETLNESRDPDHVESDRYTTRFFLKHFYLEQAYDTLAEANFHLVCASTIGANFTNDKDGPENEENKWLHYTELVFRRI